MSKIVYKKYSVDSKNLSTLFLVLFWLVLGFIVCFIGIKNTYALIVNSSFLGQNVNTNFGITANSYKQGVSSITVDQSNALNYYVVDLCTTMNFSITNLSNSSGSVSLYKIYENLGSCNTTNYDGSITRIYFKVNSWADAGNGNYGVIFSSRFNSTVSYYGDNRILNIYTTDEVDNTSELINNQTNELNNSINNSTNTITGSITDSQNNINSNIQSSQDNINSNIDNMEDAIVDSNKETQNVIKDQFNSCKDSLNIFDITSYPILEKTAYNSSGEIKYWDGYYGIREYFPILENTTYTYSQKNGFINFSVVFYDNEMNIISNLAFKSNGTFTTPINASYIRFAVQSSSIPTEVQIEKGSIATKYGPYGGQVCYNKLDEQNETQKGIWATIKDLPNMFLDMLLGLFIPDDLSFIDNFKDVISNKLGFIASIPIQIIDFMLGLANVAFEEITTISFPSISIFGFNFWNAEEIDITILLDKLKPFKYFTDFTCVILCCRTLYDFYHSFTGGDVN